MTNFKDIQHEPWFPLWVANVTNKRICHSHVSYSRQVINQFSWGKTPEGNPFWAVLNKKHHEECTYKEALDFANSFRESHPEYYI